MLTQSAAEKNSAAAIMPAPVPNSPWRVAAVQPLENFRLHVRFRDGLEGIVDLSYRVHSPDAGVFAVLADPAQFNQVAVEMGVAVWAAGIDLAPDAMYDAIRANGVWAL